MMSMGVVNVFKRNFICFTQNLGASLVWLYAESTIMFLVFGYGIGGLITNVEAESFFKFFAPGFIFATLMYVSFNETGHTFLNKLKQRSVLKSYAFLPISHVDVIFGEILWGAAKGLTSTFLLLILSLSVGILSLGNLAFLVLLLIVCAFMFSSMGMLISGISRDNNTFIFAQALFVFPMYFLSGVFFPINSMPDLLYMISMLYPLTHAIMAAKTIVALQFKPIFFINIAVLFFYSFLFYNLAVSKVRSKLGQSFT